MYYLREFCRFCLSFDGNFHNMSSGDILEKANCCIGDFEFYCNFPNLICTKCLETLDEFFNFRNRCLQSELILQRYVQLLTQKQLANDFVNKKLAVFVSKNFGTQCRAKNVQKVGLSRRVQCKNDTLRNMANTVFPVRGFSGFQHNFLRNDTELVHNDIQVKQEPMSEVDDIYVDDKNVSEVSPIIDAGIDQETLSEPNPRFKNKTINHKVREQICEVLDENVAEVSPLRDARTDQEALSEPNHSLKNQNINHKVQEQISEVDGILVLCDENIPEVSPIAKARTFQEALSVFNSSFKNQNINHKVREQINEVLDDILALNDETVPDVSPIIDAGTDQETLSVPNPSFKNQNINHKVQEQISGVDDILVVDDENVPEVSPIIKAYTDQEILSEPNPSFKNQNINDEVQEQISEVLTGILVLDDENIPEVSPIIDVRTDQETSSEPNPSFKNQNINHEVQEQISKVDDILVLDDENVPEVSPITDAYTDQEILPEPNPSFKNQNINHEVQEQISEVLTGILALDDDNIPEVSPIIDFCTEQETLSEPNSSFKNQNINHKVQEQISEVLPGNIVLDNENIPEVSHIIDVCTDQETLSEPSSSFKNQNINHKVQEQISEVDYILVLEDENVPELSPITDARTHQQTYSEHISSFNNQTINHEDVSIISNTNNLQNSLRTYTPLPLNVVKLSDDQLHSITHFSSKRKLDYTDQPKKRIKTVGYNLFEKNRLNTPPDKLKKPFCHETFQDSFIETTKGKFIPTPSPIQISKTPRTILPVEPKCVNVLSNKPSCIPKSQVNPQSTITDFESDITLHCILNTRTDTNETELGKNENLKNYKPKRIVNKTLKKNNNLKLPTLKHFYENVLQFVSSRQQCDDFIPVNTNKATMLSNTQLPDPNFEIGINEEHCYSATSYGNSRKSVKHAEYKINENKGEEILHSSPLLLDCLTKSTSVPPPRFIIMNANDWTLFKDQGGAEGVYLQELQPLSGVSFIGPVPPLHKMSQ